LLTGRNVSAILAIFNPSKEPEFRCEIVNLTLVQRIIY